MTPESGKRIEELYHAALERPEQQRAGFIAEECAGDDDLRREVEELVSQGEASRGELPDRSSWGARADRVVQLAPGARLGPYEVIGPIGAGGMGQVFQARDTRLGRDVAIKVAQGRFSDRFAREARAVASLNHPNICTLHDVGPDYLVMELIDGPTLDDRIREGAFPLDEALAVARQIAAALEAAHEKGIVHRDLKPANIKFSADGTVKVLDFGLAKSRSQSEGVLTSREMTAEMMTGQGMILGTPGYLSPEQARGREADKRADIWAFGVVLYEMLTGDRLFQGESAAEAMAAVLRHEPDLERVPARARKLLGSCLERDPKRRLRDIGDAWRLVEETTVSAVTPPPNKFWAATAAALALIAAAAGAGWWRAARPPDRPLMRYALDLGPEASGGTEADIALSPDGHRIVFPVRKPDGKVQLATRLLDQPQPTLLPGTEDGNQPFFSPDSQWIAFFAGGALSKISVLGGAPVTLANATANTTGGSWDQGGIAAALSHASSLSLIPAAGGGARLLTKLNGDEATHRWPHFLPGGNILFTESASASGMESANIAVAHRKTGKHKIVLRGGFSGQYVPGGYLLYVHEGVLFAVRFDISREETQGSPVPLVEDVAADSMRGNGRFHFTGAPDGASTLIYVAGKSTEKKWAVTMVDHSGEARPLIAPGAYYNPAFSPDGRRLVLVVGSQGTDIFVYDLARGTMTRLTSDAASDRPVWTPDGAKIVFSSKRSPPGLYWMRSDGGAEAELLLRSERSIQPWSISPDGRRLLYFEISPETGYDLGILPLDLSNPAQLKPGKPEAFLRTQFNEACPSFSPDGRWVAYFSNESGVNEVYVRPSTGDGKWQISSGGGMFAAWSPNGRELYYEGLDNRLQVVDYTAKGASFEAGKPRQWSGRQLQNVFKSNFTLAPDGKGIAIFEASDGSKTPPRVGVLLNFLDELKRRLP